MFSTYIQISKVRTPVYARNFDALTATAASGGASHDPLQRQTTGEFTKESPAAYQRKFRLQRRGHSPQFSRIEALLPPAVSILASGIFRLVFPYRAFGIFPQDQAARCRKKRREMKFYSLRFALSIQKPNFLFLPPSAQKSRHENAREKKNPPSTPPLLSMRTNYTRFGEKGEEGGRQDK